MEAQEINKLTEKIIGCAIKVHRTLGPGFRCDFLVGNKVIVDCKTVKQITSIDEAQLLNYLKIAELPIGLIINFNVLMLKNGIKRIINNLEE